MEINVLPFSTQVHALSAKLEADKCTADMVKQLQDMRLKRTRVLMHLVTILSHTKEHVCRCTW